jgi:hypothetical protein
MLGQKKHKYISGWSSYDSMGHTPLKPDRHPWLGVLGPWLSEVDGLRESTLINPDVKVSQAHWKEGETQTACYQKRKPQK